MYTFKRLGGNIHLLPMLIQYKLLFLLPHICFDLIITMVHFDMLVLVYAQCYSLNLDIKVFNQLSFFAPLMTYTFDLDAKKKPFIATHSTN